jgi:hydroxypyruvate reductase
MAAAVEEVLGLRLIEEKQLAGWVNVPADCVRPLRRITLHAARPPGVNEPTPAGVAGAEEVLRIVRSLAADDLCLCLISGGGSALMPAPAEGITLDDKLAITQYLSAAGANIEQLNTVRKQLSRMKGGGLARACRAGQLVTLIISDVLGDPLDVIASGPTVADTSTPDDAIEVLDRFARGLSQFSLGENGTVPFFRIVEYLRQKEQCEPPPPTCRVTNHVIGNNATAVDAAGQEAERLGYSPKTMSAQRSEGPAEDVGRQLAEAALAMRDGSGLVPYLTEQFRAMGGWRRSTATPQTTQMTGARCALPQPPPIEERETPEPKTPLDCLVSGGEPVVSLVDAARRGLGGRNQQLVLAALIRLAADRAAGIALLSGGTDGEDGPTDAAGALLDAEVLAAAKRYHLDTADYLARNDAYHFFRRVDGLIKTGPTHTNVCDLRVVVVERAT